MESQKAKNRVILVTGCNRGIGYGLVEKLCTNQYSQTVILTARSKQKAEGAYKKILAKNPNAKDRLFYHPLEVNDQTSRETLAKWVASKFKTIDVLINNAAVGDENDVFGPGYYGK